MNKVIMTDYFRNNPKDILNEQLAEDKPYLALIQISEPTRLLSTSYAVFCLTKKI